MVGEFYKHIFSQTSRDTYLHNRMTPSSLQNLETQFYTSEMEPSVVEKRVESYDHGKFVLFHSSGYLKTYIAHDSTVTNGGLARPNNHFLLCNVTMILLSSYELIFFSKKCYLRFLKKMAPLFLNENAALIFWNKDGVKWSWKNLITTLSVRMYLFAMARYW